MINNPLYNSGFAKRQLLTDAGKTVYCRIPLSAIFGFCALDRVIYGSNILFRLYPNNVSNIIQHALNNGATTPVTIPDGQLKIQTFDLFLANVKPSLAVQAKIAEELVAGTSEEIAWRFYDTYSFQTPSSFNNYSNVFTNISEKPEFVVFTFTPASYAGSQLYNTSASYCPTPNGANTATNLANLTNIATSYIQLGSLYWPPVYYGTINADPARMYQEYLDISSRLDQTAGMTPVLSFNDFFGYAINPATNTTTDLLANPPYGSTPATGFDIGGAFMLCFDLRHIPGDATQWGNSQQLILNLNTVQRSIVLTMFMLPYAHPV